MIALRDLTIDDIYKLEAGRETDILISEVITGQDRLMCRTDPMNRDGEPQFHYGHPHGHDFASDFSTDPSAAMHILDFVDGSYRLERYREDDNKLYFGCDLRLKDSIGVIRNCKTKELALCKALLMAHVGLKNKGGGA